jgi:hypothetical protein
LEIEELVDRNTNVRNLRTGGCLLVSRIALVVEEVEAVEVATEYVA